jgi:DNA transformation protein
LNELPNIGKTLAQKLIEVGITTPKILKEKGLKKSFLLIREKDATACLNMLYALEGAIQNIRWHDLSEQTKENLKQYYLSLK